jgi:hypothetical protein
LVVIKDHYNGKKKIEEVAIKEAADTKSNLESMVVVPWLNIRKLDELSMMFKITMKGSNKVAITSDLSLNPLTHLWCQIKASGLLYHKLSKFMKVVTIDNCDLVEDERIFSTLSFIKNKLKNQLSTHLPLVVTMYAQEFPGLEDFPYDAAYEEWRMTLKKED